MFNSFHSNKLASRLVFYILLCSSIVTLVITSIQLYTEYKRDLSDLNEKFEEIYKGYQSTIAHGLWVFDRQQMILQLEGITHIPDIDYAEITSITGHTYKYGVFPASNLVSKSWKIIHDKEEIGSFRVAANL